MYPFHLKTLASGEFENELVALLQSEMQRAEKEPYALMLSGGRTPRSAYSRLAAQPVQASPHLSILFCDERMVAQDSPESNFNNARPMLQAVGVPDDRIMRIRTEQGLEQAGAQYDLDVSEFLDSGACVTLGLLGLGLDGHVASIFTLEDAARFNKYTMTVPEHNGFERVSVTRRLLDEIERLVILVSGEEKTSILKQFIHHTSGIPAGRAVAEHPNVEIWTDIPSENLFDDEP